MNTVTINFSGTIEQLQTLLKDPPFAGREFEAVIALTLDDASTLIERLKKCTGYVHAIKEMRNERGCTIKEAKDFVERHLSGHWPTELL